uniref:SRCR domain-containing protein n=1 Tax=Cyprinodon variegatus TaxID=28743 RepID=A0A3Q2E0C4_CYPVA
CKNDVDKMTEQITYNNPLFNMPLRSNDYHLQHDDLTPTKSRRQWRFTLLIIYVILQTAFDIFLIYKGTNNSSRNSAERQTYYSNLDLSLVVNNSQETKNLRSHLWDLQNQVTSLCGAEGQLQRLRADLNQLNASNHNLENKMTTIRVQTGSPGLPGLKGQKGDSGSTGPQGPPGQQFLPIPKYMIKEYLLSANKMHRTKSFLKLSPTTVNVRLVPGRNRGRVEVMHNNDWGTICDDSFDLLDGRVICKMLGFQSAINYFTAAPGKQTDSLSSYGQESDNISAIHSVLEILKSPAICNLGAKCSIIWGKYY